MERELKECFEQHFEDKPPFTLRELYMWTDMTHACRHNDIFLKIIFQMSGPWSGKREVVINPTGRMF